MTYAGADGATLAEMARVLHYPEDEAALHRSFADLRARLEAITKGSDEEFPRWRPRSLREVAPPVARDGAEVPGAHATPSVRSSATAVQSNRCTQVKLWNYAPTCSRSMISSMREASVA